jgi:hypothetical protein
MPHYAKFPAGPAVTAQHNPPLKEGELAGLGAHRPLGHLFAIHVQQRGAQRLAALPRPAPA